MVQKSSDHQLICRITGFSFILLNTFQVVGLGISEPSTVWFVSYYHHQNTSAIVSENKKNNMSIADTWVFSYILAHEGRKEAQDEINKNWCTTLSLNFFMSLYQQIQWLNKLPFLPPTSWIQLSFWQKNQGQGISPPRRRPPQRRVAVRPTSSASAKCCSTTEVKHVPQVCGVSNVESLGVNVTWKNTWNDGWLMKGSQNYNDLW